jgi:hypothetical protein
VPNKVFRTVPGDRAGSALGDKNTAIPSHRLQGLKKAGAFLGRVAIVIYDGAMMAGGSQISMR